MSLPKRRLNQPTTPLPLLKPLGLGWSTLALLGSVALPPAIAHQVVTTESVGATLHIEPNDTPRAGEASQVWFALTRQGGDIIPLTDCDCQLRVYSQPTTDAADPLLTPPLSPVSAEGYSGIPGALVTFPEVGAYTLVLAGAPQRDQTDPSFSPFELSFDVTVATGSSASQPTTAAQPQPSDTEATENQSVETGEATASQPPVPPPPQPAQPLWQNPAVLVILIFGVGVIWGICQKRSPKE